MSGSGARPIVLTSGEPAGIGPDLCLQICQQSHPSPLIVMADIELLEQRAAQLKIPVVLHQLDTIEHSSTSNSQSQNTPSQDLDHLNREPGHLNVIHTPLRETCQPGQLNVANADSVLQQLEHAAIGCQSGKYSALITCPAHKSVLNDAGIPFTGHTEYFAQQAHIKKVVMMLATPNLRVALVTTHLPLKDVAAAIDADNVRQTLSIVNSALKQQFGIETPRILVCGLNPHAGEDGHLGTEELEIISPVIKELNGNGFNIIGPLPADTLFTPKVLLQGDAVVAMYHDQGLPVLKFQDFGEAVNITLGLPYLRTSVGHGTALDLAGSGNANPSSLLAALRLTQNILSHPASLNNAHRGHRA
ncbi:MAG: 4-hydroxythreonine-4-phosphate dehydrogenase PdxA [Moraxellaceae bacterium]|nr:MAG: 4-hydroxythreonine-4-phosphate dehydrogenase PdxA [Moraxellaceae bacterium]